MSDQGAILKSACDAALSNPKLQPVDGITYCNMAVQSIAQAMGCGEFSGLMADEIYQVMKTNPSGHWETATGQEATVYALSGGLAIAAMSSHRLEEDHGHVAVVAPLGMQDSGSLGHDVPVLANVGKTVGYMKSSEAFPVSAGEAEYFMYE